MEPETPENPLLRLESKGKLSCRLRQPDCGVTVINMSDIKCESGILLEFASNFVKILEHADIEISAKYKLKAKKNVAVAVKVGDKIYSAGCDSHKFTLQLKIKPGTVIQFVLIGVKRLEDVKELSLEAQIV